MTDPTPDFSAASLGELFRLYRGILGELRNRGVVRTENAPAGDYAEYLVAAALGGELAPNSERSWDVKITTGERLQVKSRVVSSPPRSSQLQLSPFRSFDFDEAVVVLFSDADYTVVAAVRLPRHVVEEAGRFSAHVNGHIVHARPSLLEHEEGVDVVSLLRGIAGAV